MDAPQVAVITTGTHAVLGGDCPKCGDLASFKLQAHEARGVADTLLCWLDSIPQFPTYLDPALRRQG